MLAAPKQFACIIASHRLGRSPSPGFLDFSQTGVIPTRWRDLCELGQSCSVRMSRCSVFTLEYQTPSKFLITLEICINQSGPPVDVGLSKLDN